MLGWLHVLDTIVLPPWPSLILSVLQSVSVSIGKLSCLMQSLKRDPALRLIYLGQLLNLNELFLLDPTSGRRTVCPGPLEAPGVRDDLAYKAADGRRELRLVEERTLSR